MLLWKGKLTAVGRLRPPFSAAKTMPVVTPAVPPNNKRVNSDVSMENKSFMLLIAKSRVSSMNGHINVTGNDMI